MQKNNFNSQKPHDFTCLGPMNIKTRLSQHTSKMITMFGNAKRKNEKKLMPVSAP